MNLSRVHPNAGADRPVEHCPWGMRPFLPVRSVEQRIRAAKLGALRAFLSRFAPCPGAVLLELYVESETRRKELCERLKAERRQDEEAARRRARHAREIRRREAVRLAALQELLAEDVPGDVQLRQEFDLARADPGADISWATGGVA